MKLRHLLILTAALGLARVGQAQNLIPFNPGFELGSPAGWYMWIDEKGTGNASFETVDKDAHSGVYALKFDVKRAAGYPWQISLNIPQWPAKPESHYRLSFWAKGPGAFKIHITDVDKKYAWMGDIDASASPTQWTHVTGDFNTTTQSGLGKVSLAISLGQSVGSYEFDDFEVVEVDPAGSK
jgi:hypothetical protein